MSRNTADASSSLLSAAALESALLDHRMANLSALAEASGAALRDRSAAAQTGAAEVLSYVRQRQADRSAALGKEAEMTRGPLRPPPANMAAAPLPFPLLRHDGPAATDGGNADAERVLGVEEDSSTAAPSAAAWLAADARWLQAHNDSSAAALAAASPSAAAASLAIGRSFGLHRDPNTADTSVLSDYHLRPSSSSSVAPSASASMAPSVSAASVGGAEAVRRIAALEAEVATIEYQVSHKKALLAAALADIRRREEAIRKAQMEEDNEDDATTAAGGGEREGAGTKDEVNKINGEEPRTNGFTQSEGLLASHQSRTATATAIQRSLLGTLTTERARAAVGSAIFSERQQQFEDCSAIAAAAVGRGGGGGGEANNNNSSSTNNHHNAHAHSSLRPHLQLQLGTTTASTATTAIAGATTVAGGLLDAAPSLSAATAGRANPPLMYSSVFRPSYLAELSAAVAALEAKAATSEAAARQAAAAEERIMANERAIQRLRKVIVDCRLGVLSGVGPRGDGFCGAGMAAAPTAEAAEASAAAVAAGRGATRNKADESQRQRTSGGDGHTISADAVAAAKAAAAGGDFSASVAVIADPKSTAVWRDMIRSLYVSTETNTAPSFASSVTAGESHHSSHHHSTSSFAHGLGLLSGGGDGTHQEPPDAATLILCDLEQLPHYLALAAGGGGTLSSFALPSSPTPNHQQHQHRSGGEEDGGKAGDEDAHVGEAHDTPFVYLPISRRRAYFNRQLQYGSIEGGITAAAGIGVIGVDGSSAQQQLTSSSLATSSSSRRYESAACVPKLAAEALLPSSRALATSAAQPQPITDDDEGGDEEGRGNPQGSDSTATSTCSTAAAAAKRAASRSLWGTIVQVPSDAMGACVVLLPMGAFGAMTRRIRDVAADSSLRAIAVGLYGMRSSDVSVTNRSGGGAAGGSYGLPSAVLGRGGGAPSAFSDAAFGAVATEIAVSGLLRSQVIPFVAHLLSSRLLPSSYVADSAVAVPLLLTVGGCTARVQGGGGGATAAGSDNGGGLNAPAVRVTAAHFLSHFGGTAVAGGDADGDGGGAGVSGWRALSSSLSYAVAKRAADASVLSVVGGGASGRGANANANTGSGYGGPSASAHSPLLGSGPYSSSNLTHHGGRGDDDAAMGSGYLVGSNNSILYDTADPSAEAAYARRQRLLGTNASAFGPLTASDEGGNGPSGFSGGSEEAAHQRQQAALLERQRILDNTLLSSALRHNGRVAAATFEVPKDRSAKGVVALKAAGHRAVGAFSRGMAADGLGGGSVVSGSRLRGGGGDASSSHPPRSGVGAGALSSYAASGGLCDDSHYTHASVATAEALVTAQLREILRPHTIGDMLNDALL